MKGCHVTETTMRALYNAQAEAKAYHTEAETKFRFRIGEQFYQELKDFLDYNKAKFAKLNGDKNDNIYGFKATKVTDVDKAAAIFVDNRGKVIKTFFIVMGY